MNREALIDYAYRPVDRLNVSDKDYKQWIFRYTFLELEKDLGEHGDLSSALFDDFDKEVKASIMAKQDGVIAGLSELQYFLCDSDVNFRPRVSVKFEFHKYFRDGDQVRAGDTVAQLVGPASAILAVERVSLNLLGRMSGVATCAASYCDLLENFPVKVAGTRKTLWGWLDKRALGLGGALPHRLNLSDAIIVKDTQLDLIGRDFGILFNSIQEKGVNCRFVEVEVLDKEEALEVAEYFKNSDLNPVGIVMLDNMSSKEVAGTIAALKAEGLHDSALFEASGGISRSNILDYAGTGVDTISMSALTNGVGALDLSMKME